MKYLILLLFPFLLFAENYYVATIGDNDNSGLSWTDAFLTIQWAINAADNGDTIWIGTGTFNEQLVITKNSLVLGTQYNSIIRRLYVTGNLNQFFGFHIKQRSIDSDNGIYISGDYNEFWNCWIDSTNAQGVWITTGAIRNQFYNIHVTKTECPNGGSCTGEVMFHIRGDSTIVCNSHLWKSDDYFNIWGDEVLIKHNWLGVQTEEDFGGNKHIDGIQTYGASGRQAQWITFTGNLNKYNNVANAHGIIARNTINNANDYGIIIKKNIFNKIGSQFLHINPHDSIYTANNTLEDIGSYYAGDKANYCIEWDIYGSYHSDNFFLKNNIFYDACHSINGVIVYGTETNNTFSFLNNISYLSGSTFTDGIGTIFSNPLLMNIGSDSLWIEAGSPAIGAAAPLTTVSDSGSGTAITVLCAGYFNGDYSSLLFGDWIKVGKSGSYDSVRVTAVNHTTNVLTLSSSIGFDQDDSVYYSFKTTPDIGAFEYDALGYDYTLDLGSNINVTQDTTFTPSITGDGNIDFVAFFVDDIQSANDFTSPFAYSYDLKDTLSHELKAMAFGLYSDSTLFQIDSIIVGYGGEEQEMASQKKTDVVEVK